MQRTAHRNGRPGGIEPTVINDVGAVRYMPSLTTFRTSHPPQYIPPWGGSTRFAIEGAYLNAGRQSVYCFEKGLANLVASDCNV